MEVKAGYKQTEIGVIPEDWGVCQLDKLVDSARHIRYGIVQPGEFLLGGTLMLRSQDYSRGWRDPSTMHRVSRDLATQYRNASLESGDLIMTIVGAGIGQVVIAPEWLSGAILSRSTTRISVIPTAAARGFVKAILEGPIGQIQILDCQKEGAQPVVSCVDLARFLFPAPLLAEQEAIAEALSDADTLIESLEQLIAKKSQIKQGAMQQLLTGKKRLPGFEVKSGYKQTEIGEMPEDWDAPELGEVLKSTQLGGNYQNSESETNWPLIKMGNLGRGTIKLRKIEFITSGQRPSDRDRLSEDDVLFNTRNTLDLVGKVSIWRNELAEAYFNSNIMRMKFVETKVSSNKFMNYILNIPVSIRGLRAIAIGTTSVAAIYGRDLIKLKIPLPTNLDEQTAIAETLSDMDAEIAELETKLSKARQIKQGMMQELLTGKTRLVAPANG